MKRYENWLATVMFIALLVLFALVLDVRGDVASLRRDAAYNAPVGRDLLESRVECLEEQSRTVRDSIWYPDCG